MTALRVLLVEDDPDDALLILNELLHGGFDVQERRVATEPELVDALDHGTWDLVLSEYELPGFSGTRVVEIVRQSLSDVPVIVISGTIGEEMAVDTMRAGANDHVLKNKLARLVPAVHRELINAQVRREQNHLANHLHRLRDRFHATFSEAPIGIAISTPDGNLLMVNRRYADFLEYEPQDLIGQPLSLVTHPDDGGATTEAITNAGLNGVSTYEKRFITRSGKVVSARVKIACVRGTGGETEYCIGMVEDITADLDAAQALHFQSHLLSCVEEAVIATDLQGVITYWNRYAEKLFGWTAEEVMGRRIMDTVPSAVSEELIADAMLQLLGGRSWSGEVVLQRRDGSTFEAWVTDSPIQDASGTIIGIVGASRDITLEKDSRDRLRRREAQLAEAQRIAKIGSWERDLTTGASFWSDEVYDLLGLARGATATSDAFLALVHPDDREQVRDLATRANWIEPRALEFRLITPDGQHRVIYSRGVPETDDSGLVVRIRGYMQDVTDRKATEAALAKTSAQQEAIAGLSRAVLRGAAIDLLFDLGARSAGHVLDAEMSEVIELMASDELRVAAAYGWPEAVSERMLSVTEESWIQPVIRSGDAIVVNDMDTRTIEGQDEPIHRGILSGAAAPIVTGDGRVVGAIAVRSAKRNIFTVNDVNFLRTIANVLAQAVERQRTFDALQDRAAQQAALAEFTRTALTGVNQDLLELACDTVMQLLRVEYCSVWDNSDDESFYVCRAGRRVFDDGRIISADGRSPIPYSGRTQTTVVVDDYATETRFDVRSFQTRGMRAGVTVPIRGAEQPFGVITAHTRTIRTFTDGDVRFVQSIANALAEAMERDAAQRALMASEERYRSVVEGSDEIIYTIDRTGRLTTINRAFGKTTGWTREDWIGRPFVELLHPADRERGVAYFRDVLAGKNVTGEFTILARDGSFRLIDVAATPVFKNGEMSGLHGFAHDITDKKRIDAERVRLTRDLQLLLQSTEEGIVAVDNSGHCILVNRSAADLIGVDADALQGTDIHAQVHPSCGGCAFTLVLAGGAAERVHDSEFTRSSGERFPVEFAIAPLLDDGVRKGAVLTFNEVTERLKLEAQLAQATRLTSLGRLAATIAHEFNNVLMGISPFVELLRRGTITEERRITSLDHIDQSVKRGKRITEDILRFTNPAEPVLEPVALIDWMDRVTSEMTSVLGERFQIELEIGEPSLQVIADVNQLHQVMTNLLLNARDAMTGGGRIVIRLSRDEPDTSFPFGIVERPERFAHIAVEDEGCGIAADLITHIFEPLFTTKRTGTGLGLAVTHQVVKRHGGELFVESKVGKGACFHIFLPLAKREADTRARIDVAPVRSNVIQRVLLVVDDIDVVAGMSALLQSEGIEVTVIGRDAEVLAAIERIRPNAVVLDTGLPDMDGSLYASIAARHPRLPVVFSAGHGDERKIEPYLANSNVAMLLKPYAFEKLLETLARVTRPAFV